MAPIVIPQPTAGEVIYNIRGIAVAKYNADGSYGEPVGLKLYQTASWEYEHDTDEIKAGGVITNAISIPTKANGTISQAAFDLAGISIMTGMNQTSDGVLKNWAAVAGGGGLSYFGMMVLYAAEFGGLMRVFLPKCMLESLPPMTAEQNAFRVGEMSFNAYAPSLNNRRILWYDMDDEGDTLEIPNTAADWDTLYTDIFV